jgi:hypothetical protein
MHSFPPHKISYPHLPTKAPSVCMLAPERHLLAARSHAARYYVMKKKRKGKERKGAEKLDIIPSHYELGGSFISLSLVLYFSLLHAKPFKTPPSCVFILFYRKPKKKEKREGRLGKGNNS